jgi:hypothetical protein
MRFSRRRNRKSWTRETSLAAHAAKARKRLEQANALPRSDVPVGEILHTLRWTSHKDGVSTEIKLIQAPRRNQIVVETFGRCSLPHGTDWFMRHLRSRLVTRWSHSE